MPNKIDNEAKNHPLPKDDEVFVYFYKGKGDLIHKLIRWWTKGPYSHCEIATSEEVFSSSSKTNGSSIVMITDETVYSLQDWDMVRIKADPVAIKNWFTQHFGLYDYFGVFGFIIRPIPETRGRTFCSESIAGSLGYLDPWRYDPNTLYSALKPLTIN